ncbi:MAG TPA: Hsp20/alpha crystallin family protein [Gaiellaceae bacterium]|nr:Hsp20/alpha crystallin family protein [Gaiellaceae bacterium]
MEKRRDLARETDDVEQLVTELWQIVPLGHGIRHGYRPQVDCFRTGDPPQLAIIVELPGVDPDRIRLAATPRRFVVAGVRERPKDCGHYQRMEIEYGPFQREVTLTEEVDPAGASASYERGILRVTLPIVVRPTIRESILIEVTLTR